MFFWSLVIAFAPWLVKDGQQQQQQQQLLVVVVAATCVAVVVVAAAAKVNNIRLGLRFGSCGILMLFVAS